MIIKPPSQIRTTLNGRNRELICRKCGRLGETHVWFLPHHCRDYETESILTTTFEAVVEFAAVVIPDPEKKQ